MQLQRASPEGPGEARKRTPRADALNWPAECHPVPGSLIATRQVGVIRIILNMSSHEGTEARRGEVTRTGSHSSWPGCWSCRGPGGCGDARGPIGRPGLRGGLASAARLQAVWVTSPSPGTGSRVGFAAATWGRHFQNRWFPLEGCESPSFP